MPQVLPLTLQRRPEGRINPHLDGVRKALDRLGDPQASFPSVLIGGTNGKGSTAAMLEAVLGRHGLLTGLYTSPHLVRVEERIRIGGEAVSGADLEGALTRLEAYPELSFFEALTVAAFLLFADSRVDFAILEVGMGGRWDATRAAGCRLAGLTNVGTDHARWLGASRHEIAAEKGAALADARLAVIGSGVEPELVDHLGADVVTAESLVRMRCDRPSHVVADWGAGAFELAVPLAGGHQHENLHLALALAKAAEDVGILDRLDPGAVQRGLGAVSWPGRLSRHSIEGREILVDVAHNLEAAQALARYLMAEPTRFNLLFSCLEDKPVEAMAAELRPVVGRVAICPLADERAMPIESLRAAWPGATVAPHPSAALAVLPDPVIVAGSLRLVGALLESAGPQEGRP
jgi:dihydrofolate synthase/folylpolyglutamate synthase